jgi:predicted amidophosphoribosyltransferase
MKTCKMNEKNNPYRPTFNELDLWKSFREEQKEKRFCFRCKNPIPYSQKISAELCKQCTEELTR